MKEARARFCSSPPLSLRCPEAVEVASGSRTGLGGILQGEEAALQVRGFRFSCFRDGDLDPGQTRLCPTALKGPAGSVNGIPSASASVPGSSSHPWLHVPCLYVLTVATLKVNLTFRECFYGSTQQPVTCIVRSWSCNSVCCSTRWTIHKSIPQLPSKGLLGAGPN